VILRNHGLLTVGTTVDSAAWWFLTMERSCQAQLLAMAAGPLVEISPESAALTQSQIGSEYLGWLSFQPLFDRIVREQPDIQD
jgi:ribulose-5-phosphate 4-epimerase/fuculose-1-phosphate aldolase